MWVWLWRCCVKRDRHPGRVLVIDVNFAFFCRQCSWAAKPSLYQQLIGVGGVASCGKPAGPLMPQRTERRPALSGLHSKPPLGILIRHLIRASFHTATSNCPLSIKKIPAPIFQLPSARCKHTVCACLCNGRKYNELQGALSTPLWRG